MYSSNEKFIIGLGNPGEKYNKNRHNIGFLFIKAFSDKFQSKFTLKNKYKAFYSEFKYKNVVYRLFMPNTFMNNSGEAVRAITDWFKISRGDFVVIVDDIDLPIGKVRLRKKGSSGGHNGLKSIINHIHSDEFIRIKIGIGSAPSLDYDKKINTISHVLGDFSQSENIIINKIFQQIIDFLENVNTENQDAFICKLNSFNGLS
tara:strand:- start:2271 stop:2879 length:609 start_codon:yes stop_codon:yes gene_type:complete